MKPLFLRLLPDDTAATAIEHGLIAAGISLAIIAVRERTWQQSQQHVHVD